MFARIPSQVAALGFAATLTLAALSFVNLLAAAPVEGSLFAKATAAATSQVAAAVASAPRA